MCPELLDVCKSTYIHGSVQSKKLCSYVYHCWQTNFKLLRTWSNPHPQVHLRISPTPRSLIPRLCCVCVRRKHITELYGTRHFPVLSLSEKMTVPIVSPIFSGKWPGKTAEFLVSAMSSIVFLFLDFLDILLCVFFKIVDEFFEGNAGPCYCHNRGEGRAGAIDERGSEVSETLYGRENVFREMGSVRFPIKSAGFVKNGGGNGIVGNRWSDCGCESCVSWMSIGDQRLHVVVKQSSKGIQTSKSNLIILM